MGLGINIGRNLCVGTHRGALLNQNPTDILLSVSSINENNAIGAVIGAFSTTDADNEDTFTYILVSGAGSTDNASFTIDGANLKAAVVFDYETKNSYSIRVRSTDLGGLFVEKQFTITINDVVEVPTVPDGTPTSTYDISDTAFKVISSVSTNSSTVVTLEYGTASGVYTNTVTAAESPVLATGDVNFALTGLTPFTNYYFRVKAENSAGIAYSQEFVQKTAWQNTAPSLLTLTVISDTQINLSWQDNSIGEDDFRIERSTNGINYTEIGNTTGTTFNNTSLNTYTQYYYRVRARQGTNYSNYSNAANATTLFNATLTATGTGAGVSTLRLEVSENQTLTITSGNARFYTDAAGTTGESTTWAITTGALRTIYLKAPSGDSVINIPKPDKITGIGGFVSGSNVYGFESAVNSARLVVDINKFTNVLRILSIGFLTLTGTLSSKIMRWVFDGNNNIMTSNKIVSNDSIFIRLNGGNDLVLNDTSKLPDNITYISLSGNNINYTTTDFSGNADITFFNLGNWRIPKLTSEEMVTILTSLTNRVGGLPATIIINDYGDWASPPTSVTNAVAALKAAKPNVTTINLGA